MGANELPRNGLPKPTTRCPKMGNRFAERGHGIRGKLKSTRIRHITGNMKQLVPVWAGVALFLFSGLRATAWSSAGHQVIAAEAYRQLPPEVKAKASEILKAHPDYEKWKDSFTGGSASLDLDTYIFMRASTWPDEIHHRGNPYDHPDWHFVDYPLKP